MVQIAIIIEVSWHKKYQKLFFDWCWPQCLKRNMCCLWALINVLSGWYRTWTICVTLRTTAYDGIDGQLFWRFADMVLSSLKWKSSIYDSREYKKDIALVSRDNVICTECLTVTTAQTSSEEIGKNENKDRIHIRITKTREIIYLYSWWNSKTSE